MCWKTFYQESPFKFLQNLTNQDQDDISLVKPDVLGSLIAPGSIPTPEGKIPFERRWARTQPTGAASKPASKQVHQTRQIKATPCN